MNQPSPFNKNANKNNVRNFSWGKTPVPGQTGIKGKILEIGAPVQATKYNPNPSAPKVLDWWDDEKTRAKYQVMLLLQTELNEGPDEDGNPDDGRRKLFIIVDYKPGGQLAAIQDAMDQVGAEDIEVGAFLALWFTGYDPDSANPAQPRRLFQSNYQRPAAGGGAFQPQQPPIKSEYQQQVTGPPQPPTQQNPYGVNPGLGNPYGAGGDMGQPYGQPPQQRAAYTPAQEGFGQQPAYTPPQQQAQPPQGGGFDPATQGFNPGTGEVAPTYQPPQQAAAPPQQQQVQVNVDDVRARIAAGQQDGQIMAETGASQEAISALRNLTQPY